MNVKIMPSATKKRIGILRGGGGEHYAHSLKRGGDIILHISENLGDKYKVYDILIDKDYIWHFAGVPVTPGELSSKVDIVWNATHPSFSNILESLSIPTIGLGSFSSTLGGSREMLREHMKKIGVAMPRHMLLPLYQIDFDGPRERYAIKKAKAIFEKFGSPWIVKSFGDENMGPVRSRSPQGDRSTLVLERAASNGMGVHLAKTFNELVAAIDDGVAHGKSILVEEFIAGKVASLHSMPHFRGEDFYIFPPVNVFGNLSSEEKEKLTSLVKGLHIHIGAKHYLKSDFILNPRGKVYLLDFESMPNVKSFSHFSEACASVGAKMHHVVEHILEHSS